MHFAKPCRLIGAILLLLAAAPFVDAHAGDSERTIVSGGRQREFILHVPTNAPPGPKPVVIALHGALQPAGVMQRYLDLDAVADREGFIVAYPKGMNLLWNDGRSSVAGFLPILFERDDGRFVLDVMERLVADGLADPSRAYLMGFSNGGFLTAYMACRYPDRFAAFATMMMTVPVNYAQDCKPSRPAPILMMNGTYDPIVPMFGRPTPGARLMSATESAQFFARLGRCTSPQVTTGDGVRIARWKQCAGGSEVAFYEIAGGHQPPTQSADAMDALAAVVLGPRRSGLDAPREIWSFFERYRTPGTAPSAPPADAPQLVAARAANPAPVSSPAAAAPARPGGTGIVRQPETLASAWQGIAPIKGGAATSGTMRVVSVRPAGAPSPLALGAIAAVTPPPSGLQRPMTQGAPLPLQSGFTSAAGAPAAAPATQGVKLAGVAPLPPPSPLRQRSASVQ